MVGRHHWFKVHELGQTVGDGEGQGCAAVHGVTKSWHNLVTEHHHHHHQLEQTTCSGYSSLSPKVLDPNLASNPGILGMLLKFSKSSFSHVKMETTSTNLVGLLWTAGVLTDSVALFKYYSWAEGIKLLVLELGVSAFTLEIQTDAILHLTLDLLNQKP